MFPMSLMLHVCVGVVLLCVVVGPWPGLEGLLFAHLPRDVARKWRDAARLLSSACSPRSELAQLVVAGATCVGVVLHANANVPTRRERGRPPAARAEAAITFAAALGARQDVRSQGGRRYTTGVYETCLYTHSNSPDPWEPLPELFPDLHTFLDA